MRILLFILLFTGLHTLLQAQCVMNFPYYENFESNNGNWTAGGTNSDWAWGTPAKSRINRAGEGSKSWITGGLTANFYAYGQASYLTSPCFDFSTLNNPYVFLKVFWDTESVYDGANLQISQDNGATWATVGNLESNSQCRAQNWYNAGVNLNSTPEYLWSGNPLPTSGSCRGGGGRGVWLNAWHELRDYAGLTNIKFRFYFKAGTLCNNFNGFAIDSIVIKDMPLSSAGIEWQCTAPLTMAFAAVNNTCIQNYVWNFGDAASGAANHSTQPNPVHAFSAPGTYNVVLAYTTTGGLLLRDTVAVTVAAIDLQTTQPNICTGNNTGSIMASSAAPLSPIAYLWNTNPAQTTAAIANLQPGNYTVTASYQNTCIGMNSAIIQPPGGAAPAIAAQTEPTGCTGGSGSIQTTVTGGTAPYTYAWSNGATTPAIQQLTSGNYILTVTDAAGCTARDTFFVPAPAALQISLGNDTTICSGMPLTLSPGSFSSYLWSTGSTAPSITATAPGPYSVTVTATNGCTASVSVTISTDCSAMQFPNAFSPNNDGINDLFGPAGNTGGTENYVLSVYNRYGQRVFSAGSPQQKWNGLIAGKPAPAGAYVWVVQYRFLNEPVHARGTVILLR